MKKRILILSVLALFLSVSSQAYDFKVGGIYYDILSEEDLTCEVTYLSTSNSNYSAYQGSVDIPNTVEFENATYTVKTIGESAFRNCTSLTSVTFPNSVTTIGGSAFLNCSGLTEINIHNGVTSIGDYAFSGCSGLTSELIIPNSVTTIGGSAFYKCTGLTSLTIGEGVTSMGDQAFSLCTGLTQVNFNAIACTSILTSTSYSYYFYAFYGCTNVSKVNIGNNVTIIPDYLCYEMTGLTGTLTIPNSVTSIGYGAFYKCAGLTSVTIGNSVTTIGGSAFYHCTGLTSLTIGNSVTSIGSSAFSSCSGLTGTLTIPNSATSIGSSAFQNCSGLTSVTIGNSVTTLGADAFRSCSKLKSITSLNPEPPSCNSSNYGVFYNVDYKTCILYVPDGSLETYANASEWKNFYNIIEIEVDAIADITTNGNAEAVGYYTMDGKQVPTLQRGVNIVRYSDGTGKKVLVK